MTTEFGKLGLYEEPRDREEVMAELRSSLNREPGFKFWKLVTELEEGAWRGGFDEGYDHGHIDGVEFRRKSDERLWVQ